MRVVLIIWVIFHGIRSHVFKQYYTTAAESQKVPLEIFSNPTILSDDSLRGSEFSDFFTPSLCQKGEKLSPPLSRPFPAEGRQGRLGRILQGNFKQLKCFGIFNLVFGFQPCLARAMPEQQ
jgi:hypothetical protein